MKESSYPSRPGQSLLTPLTMLLLPSVFHAPCGRSLWKVESPMYTLSVSRVAGGTSNQVGVRPTVSFDQSVPSTPFTPCFSIQFECE